MNNIQQPNPFLKSVILETKYSPINSEQEKITQEVRNLLVQKGIKFNQIDSALAFVFDASQEDIEFFGGLQNVEIIRENKMRHV